MHIYETTNLLELVNSRLEFLGVKDETVLQGLRAITGEYLKKSVGGFEFFNDELVVTTDYAEDAVKYSFNTIYSDCINTIEIYKKDKNITIGMFLNHEFYNVFLKDNIIETDETKELVYTRSESVINDGDIDSTKVWRQDGVSGINQEAIVQQIGVKLLGSEYFAYNKNKIISVPSSKYLDEPVIVHLHDIIESTKKEMDKEINKEDTKKRRLQM